MLNRKFLSIFPAITVLIIASCAVSSFDPNTGEVRASAPSSSLVTQGHQQFDKMKREKKISTNPTYNAQVQRVAARLKSVIDIPNARWEFVVFEDSTPNAFALPGGKVGVHTGLFQITQNDAGLAAVLGHEIAHVVLNHSQQRVNQATVPLVLPSVTTMSLPDGAIVHEPPPAPVKVSVIGAESERPRSTCI